MTSSPPAAPRGANDPEPDSSLRALLQPESVAVIGATERIQYGGRFVLNLRVGGFQGRLYPVNPSRETVFGLRCYPSIAEVPEPVDLAAIIIPAERVIDSLEACAQAGTRSVIIISAGFSEIGPAGQARQEAIAEFSRRTGIRVVGPNCLGLANVGAGIWATASGRLRPELLPPLGPIGLISQSGASAFGPLLTAFRDRQTGLRYVISTGNEADLELSELLRYLLRDPEIRAVALFAEGIRNPDGFLLALDEALLLGKPIVLLKVGRSEVGRQAAATHTAALAGSDAVQDALFRQRGVVRAEDYDEFAELTRLLAYAPLPAGNRVGVVSHSGGITGLLGDKIGEQGLAVPPLSEQTQQRLAEILEGRGAATNPADITGHFQRESFVEILDLLGRDPQFDLLALATAGSQAVVQRVIDGAAASGKPTAYVWTGSLFDQDGLPHLRASTLPAFHLPGRAARGLRALVDYAALRRRLADGRLPWRSPLPPELTAVAAGLRGRAALTETASYALLAEAGLPVEAGRLCTSEAEALAAAHELGYPVVVKAISGQVLHKTEADAVRVGLVDDEALRTAYQVVLTNLRQHHPAATVDGVLVQRQLAGIETIAGVARDDQFGPVLLLGLGGILAEALAATSLRLCPIDADDAEQMIAEVPGLGRLLDGFRGQPPADRQALVETLVRLSQLGYAARDELDSLDLNPLIVLPTGQGARAVDALVVPRASI